MQSAILLEETKKQLAEKIYRLEQELMDVNKKIERLKKESSLNQVS